MMLKRLIIFIFILGTVSGCAVRQTVTGNEEQVANVYNPSELSLNTDYKVYHSTDDISTLYIRLFPNELLFNQANENAEYLAVVRLDLSVFELSDNERERTRVDSLTTEIKLRRNDMNQSAFLTSMMLQLESDHTYILEIKTKDMLRGSFGMRYVYVDKKSRYSAQNFNIVNASNGFPKFRNYFLSGEVFRLYHRYADFDTLYLDVLSSDGPLPKPPISSESPSYYPYVTDTILTIPYSDTSLYTLPGKGVFRLRVDTLSADGLLLMNLGDAFPRIKTENDLFGPLFYITTAAEYNSLKKESNKKLAVDDFWLRLNPSMERSRELIRIYYNRVLYSNLYFTADREGWKTDRGMVFILFGPPDRMLDVGIEQSWYYISRRRNKIIQFNFLRRPSPYTNDNFTLVKNVETMGYWNEAVRSWRNGKVFSLSN